MGRYQWLKRRSTFAQTSNFALSFQIVKEAHLLCDKSIYFGHVAPYCAGWIHGKNYHFFKVDENEIEQSCQLLAFSIVVNNIEQYY